MDVSRVEGRRLGARDRPSALARAAWSLGALDARLNLRRRGREDGARDHPASDASAMSAAKTETLAAMGEARADLDSEREAARQELEQRLRALKPAAPDLSGPVLEARLAMKQIEQRFAHDWADTRARARRAKAELGAFRERHRLERDAHIKHAAVLQAGLLLCAALAESDPYPDYGKMARAERAARLAVSELRNEALELGDAQVDAAKAALGARLDALRAALSSMLEAFNDGARERQALSARGRQVEDLQAAALEVYRKENTAVRTSPAPPYLSAPMAAPASASHALDGAAGMIDAARAAVGEAERGYAQALSDLSAAMEETQARLDASP